MARTTASKKYQLTLNNPKEHDWSHDFIRNALSSFSGLVYWCMCDEVGAEGTPHIHVYVVFSSAVEFKRIKSVFYGAHIERASGTNQENLDYVRKEGKWIDNEKRETNIPDTFEEYGELPPDRAAGVKQSEDIYRMVKENASDCEILEAYPSAMNRLDKIERTRQTLKAEATKNVFRNLDTTYLWGKTGVGKTRSVMEHHGYENVYRITDYAHPFDGYASQDVILFDEFQSSLPITDMLVYLDGYPVALPCRYSNKQACFTTAYVVSNIPLSAQYPNIQIERPETWDAFRRRLIHIYEILPPIEPGEDWIRE